MSTAATAAGDSPRAIAISVGALVWAFAVAVYLGLRLGPIWQAPVGGLELTGLSGAWQASNGANDPRFYGTIAQWIASATLAFTESPVPARLVSYAASATVPAAFFVARARIGDVPALAALLLIAFDGVLIHLTVAATPLALDVPLAAWLLVALLNRERMPWWSWGVAATAILLSGPIALPLAAAGVIVYLPSDRQMNRRVGGAILAGVGVALVLSLAAPDGLGRPDIPVLRLMADGFEQTWSSTTVAGLTLLYSWPVLALGSAAAVWIYGRRRDLPLTRVERLAGAWALFSLVWFVAALASHQAAPNAAFALPAAVIAGLAVPAAASALTRVVWTVPALLVAAAFVGLAIAYVPAAEWADRGTASGTYETATLVFGLVITGAVVVLLAWDRPMRAGLLAFCVPLAVAFLLRGTFGVALSGRMEPLPSPASAPQARDLARLAQSIAGPDAGIVAVDESLGSQATWPFRGVDNVVIESEPPGDAAVLVWRPLGEPPEGFAQLQGNWSLLERIEPPTSDVLDYVQWLADPNSLSVERPGIVAYVRDEE